MKEFNTTGVCIPEKHYMVDISNKLDQIESLVEKGKYFTINRPRQYGKTTSMHLLEKRLEAKDYLPIFISFEGIGDDVFKAEDKFCRTLLSIIKRDLNYKKGQTYKEFIEEHLDKVENFAQLDDFIFNYIEKVDKRVVLMIDEVDKSSNNQLFLSFIAMLRDKYLRRELKKDKTFHSVLLAGVYDVKNLKLKLRADEEKKYNSPWNIAVDFEVEMDFNTEEIASMLKAYQEEKKSINDIEKITDKLYYYTSGYPYLVSKLCQIIDEKIIVDRENKEWTEKDVDEAVKIFLNMNSVNFDSLIKNLENDQRLYEFVESIIYDGKKVTYNQNNELINKGEMFGILENKDGLVKVHNRIYEQLIYDYMSTNIEINNLSQKDMNFYNYKENFITDQGYLDFEKILDKFQLFIKEEYSEKDKDFLERNGRLVFLAFIKPIINGKGFDFKEVQISQEKRLDVVITYLDKKYIVELKVWRGEKYHQTGLKQLNDYLGIQNVDKGYLLSFDFNKNKEYKQERIKLKDKEIYAVWV
ncbi:AAA-like domain-containing protein [Natronospora cellulosivora (SeqCode)]